MQADPDCPHCFGSGWRSEVDTTRVRVNLLKNGKSVGWKFVTDPNAIRIPGFEYVVLQEHPTHTARCGCRTSAPRTVFDLPADFRDARLENYIVRRDNIHAIEAAKEFLEVAVIPPRPPAVKTDDDVTSAFTRVRDIERPTPGRPAPVKRKVAEPKRRHLFLSGGVGTGKSRLAASLANEAADRGRTAAYIHMPWFFILQMRAFDDPTKRKEAHQLSDRAFESDVVVFDDLAGGEKGSDYTRGVFVTLIERRFSHRRCTIVTSNLSLQQLSEFFSDDRIPSRIAGACGEVIQLEGSDQRVASPVVGGLRRV